jgi:uncharacterized membrane protein YidH (DUF202 family)
MTALAVALAVGRIVPLLGETAHQWTYTVIGVGFAIYGFAMIAYGSFRARQVMAALGRGEDLPPEGPVIAMLTGAGVALALATAILIIVE